MTGPQTTDAGLEALKRLQLAAVLAPTGTCATCQVQDQLLYRLEPTDPTSPLSCAPCVRLAARSIGRYTPCDNGDGRWAWRNPQTRRNEYLCGPCHVESGDGVIVNKWAPRVSIPLGRRPKELCAVGDGVAGTRQCEGQVKPRGARGVTLCDRHAGTANGRQPAGGATIGDTPRPPART